MSVHPADIKTHINFRFSSHLKKNQKIFKNFPNFVGQKRSFTCYNIYERKNLKKSIL